MVQEVDEEETDKTKELWKESEKLPQAVLQQSGCLLELLLRLSWDSTVHIGKELQDESVQIRVGILFYFDTIPLFISSCPITQNVDQYGLKLTEIYLTLPPGYWNKMCVLPHKTCNFIIHLLVTICICLPMYVWKDVNVCHGFGCKRQRTTLSVGPFASPCWRLGIQFTVTYIYHRLAWFLLSSSSLA